MADIKVSVIIPIYKVEKFIERCAESLLSQTLNDVEYIFVDDASPDKSIDRLTNVIKSHPHKASNVSIYRHKKNKGLPSARNTGMSYARGKYMFHCDGDDYVEPQLLETMYNEANDNDSDIVWSDWFLSFSKKERYMKQPEYEMPLDALKGMMSGAMKFNVWNKLAKRSLYVDNNVTFPDGYGMGEDMTMMILFSYAEKIRYIPQAFYHYVKTNTNAFSCTYSAQHIMELRHNVARIEKFIRNRYGSTLDREISYMKLEAKFPLLLSKDKKTCALWEQLYPEANDHILSNRNISSRSKILQWVASRNQFWIVRLYRCVLNIYYKIIYK